MHDGASRFARDMETAARIASGDEGAFTDLVRAVHPSLLRLARARGAGDAAGELTQETWRIFVETLARYEGRSSLRTWLSGILLNVARSHTRREARSTPFSALAPEGEGEERAVPEERFWSADHAWAGHWAQAPTPFPRALDPAERRELREKLAAEIERLPPAQREVVMLRDVEGWSGEEVSNALAISDTHQRVLLHRARGRLRAALESFGRT